ncbi:hypothetical protein ANN_12350 [Periplaneta americana]|uniref:Uncharacterized protein n=1 Tax=Periplaneta americana TaxID=6978 RepID=A0ABQ8TI95_PERAM|nr:hypothetical protein ANN_12350 [Periplaneta americana]
MQEFLEPLQGRDYRRASCRWPLCCVKSGSLDAESYGADIYDGTSLRTHLKVLLNLPMHIVLPPYHAPKPASETALLRMLEWNSVPQVSSGKRVQPMTSQLTGVQPMTSQLYIVIKPQVSIILGYAIERELAKSHGGWKSNTVAEEYADIVYVYGLCDGSSLLDVAEYEGRFPNRRVPYRRVQYILYMWLDERLGIPKEGENKRGANRPYFGCCTPHKEQPRATLPSDERDLYPSAIVH